MRSLIVVCMAARSSAESLSNLSKLPRRSLMDMCASLVELCCLSRDALSPSNWPLTSRAWHSRAASSRARRSRKEPTSSSRACRSFVRSSWTEDTCLSRWSFSPPISSRNSTRSVSRLPRSCRSSSRARPSTSLKRCLKPSSPALSSWSARLNCTKTCECSLMPSRINCHWSLMISVCIWAPRAPRASHSDAEGTNASSLSCSAMALHLLPVTSNT
mmetsp:Transcript_38545/g.86697  ORF Transcript_38545/g.86697 Transcript_38545/m.86697 type:complete len:216 (+) Transcript_38545:184-831(+)